MNRFTDIQDSIELYDDDLELLEHKQEGSLREESSQLDNVGASYFVEYDENHVESFASWINAIEYAEELGGGEDSVFRVVELSNGSHDLRRGGISITRANHPQIIAKWEEKNYPLKFYGGHNAKQKRVGRGSC